MKTNVLIYGATGSQASPVVYALLNKGYEAFAVTHTPQKSEPLKEAGATIVIADMANRERIFEISQGMDAVSLLIPFFIANPLDGLEYAKNAIDGAKLAGVKLIVWNTSGFILPFRTGNPAIDVRLDIADYLRSSGVPYIIIQPSAYAENLLGPWNAPFVAQKNQAAYPTPEEMPIGWIATQDVASLIVAAIERPELAGSEFMVSGLENLNGPALAQRFSEALERPIDFYAMPPSEFGQILDNVFGPGAGKGAAGFYQQLHDTQQFPPMFVEMKPVLEKLPVRITPLKEWIVQHKTAFQNS